MDCGGSCSPCATGKTCVIHADCDGAKNECDSGVCVVGCADATTSACTSCTNMNDLENVDGACSGDGNCCSAWGHCGGTVEGQTQADYCVALNADVSPSVAPTDCSCLPSCTDGLLNQDETDVSTPRAKHSDTRLGMYALPSLAFASLSPLFTPPPPALVHTCVPPPSPLSRPHTFVCPSGRLRRLHVQSVRVRQDMRS